MIPDIVGQSSSRFDQRFFTTALVPVAIFAPAIAAVVLHSRGLLSSLVASYARQSPVSQVLASLAVAALVWFLATLLDSQTRNVVRLYEGYPLLRAFALVERLLKKVDPRWQARAWGIAGHQWRRQRLRQRAIEEQAERMTGSGPTGSVYDQEPDVELYDSYPLDPNRVMPTTLGNILRAAEDYGYHRYGFDSIHLWPRLTAVLPEEYLLDVEKSIIRYQTPLMVSFGFAGLALGSFTLTVSKVSTSAFVSLFAGSILLSWIAYRVSFAATRSYGDLIRTAIDLHRTQLLKRWWPELLKIEDDRRRLKILRHFVITGERLPARSFATSHQPPVSPNQVGTDVTQPKADASDDEDLVLQRWPAPRLTHGLAIGLVLLTFAGVHSLDRKQWVLAATSDIRAFEGFAGNVAVVRMRRGSAGPAAYAKSDRRSDIRVTDVSGAVALRRVRANSVIGRPDVGPEAAIRPVVGLVRPGVQVRALDLRGGDEVHLEARVPTSLTQCVDASLGLSHATTPTSVPLSTVTVVKGTVLAVVRSGPENAMSVVVSLQNNRSAPCLGDLSQVEIVRIPT